MVFITNIKNKKAELMQITNINSTKVNNNYKKLNNIRRVVSMGTKAVILGTGTVAAKFAAKDGSSLQTGGAAITDFLVSNLSKGLKYIDKKQTLTKNITGILDKIVSSSPKAKALGFIGVVTASGLLAVIQKNNQIKGVIAGSRETVKTLTDNLFKTMPNTEE